MEKTTLQMKELLESWHVEVLYDRFKGMRQRYVKVCFE